MPLNLLKNNIHCLLSFLARWAFLVCVLTSCSLWERLNQRDDSSSTGATSFEDCNTSSRNSQSNFIVGQVEAATNSAITLDSKEGLTNKFRLNLKARLTDILQPDLPIQNASFDIKYYSSAKDRDNNKITTKSVVSDSNGYIQWEELYDYRYKMKPSWIVLERTINGGQQNARYVGAEIIQMAVNPWLSEKDKGERGEPPILDIRCEYSGTSDIIKDLIQEEGLDYLSQTKPEERPLLWVQNIKFQIEEIDLGLNNKLVEEYEQLKKEKREKVKVLEGLKLEGLENLLSLTIGELESEVEKYKEEKKITAIENYIKAKQKEQDVLSKLLKRLQSTCTGEDHKEEDQGCYKRTFKISLFFDLQYKYFDQSGEPTEKILEGGAYDVESQFLISSQSEHYRLHEEKDCQKADIKIEASRINFECEFNMSYFDTNDKYTLFLEVKPHENKLHKKQLPFNTFQGVYTLEDIKFKNIHQDNDLDVTLNGKKINSQYYIKAYEDPTHELEIKEDLDIKSLRDVTIKEELRIIKDGEEYKPHPFGVIDPQELQLEGHGDYKLSHIEGGGCHQRENVVTRTVSFIGKICLKDHLRSRTLSETSFRVFVEKGDIVEDKEGDLDKDKANYSLEEQFFDEKQIFQTDDDDCISLPITLKHKIYDRQKYYKVKVHVFSQPYNFYGQVDLALSPWQRAFQAFQDAQNIDERSIRYSTDGISKPQLIINQFRSINLFPSYGLDKLLNIHLFHRVYFLFQPFIRRPDNLAFGLQHGSRELLRDGHYLVRVLLLRNPQETGNISRAESTTTWEENQSKPHQGDETHINLDGMEYITHTDSVAKAEANFINFYMPLYISTSQFLYIASRNLLVVEIYPADPDGFVYDENCNVDIEKTTWKKFDDHELLNGPYVGVMNLQNWVNWNLLQPATGNTDKIIDNYPTARQYRHFTFHPSDEKPLEVLPKTDSVDVIKLNGEMNHNEFQDFGDEGSSEAFNTWSQEIKQRDRHIKNQEERQEKFIQNHSEGKTPLESLHASSEALVKENSSLEPENPNSVRSLDLDNETAEDLKEQLPSEGDQHPALEEYGETVAKNIGKFDILENFAKENSLKIIDFSSDEELNKHFMTDMSQAFEELKNFLDESSISFFNRSKKTYLSLLADLFPKEIHSIDLALLREQFLAFCPRPNKGISRLLQNISKVIECEKEILSTYLAVVKRLSTNPDPLFHFFNRAKEKALIEKDFWTNREPEECQSFYSYFSCYQNNREAVLEVMEKVSELSLENRYFLKEMLKNLLSDKGKEQLLHTFQRGCSRGLQISSQYETCYWTKVLELLDNSDHYQYFASTFSSDIKRFTQSKSLPAQFQNKIQTLVSNPDWDDILKSVLDLSSFFESPENIYQLIDEGITKNNQNKEEVVAFTKSLCLFWMDSYIKKYLDEEQRLQAYTNFVKKFDYFQMSEDDIRPLAKEVEQVSSFWDDLPQFLSVALSPQKEENLFSNLGDNTENSVRCYGDYAQCMVSDYCLDISYIEKKTAKTEYCKNLKQGANLKDSACEVLLKDKCEKNPDIYPCNSNGVSCNKRAKSYCEVNRDQEFCEKYNNRCYSGYLSCLKSNTDSPLFNVDGVLNYDSKNKKAFAPLQTCLRNPLEFFKFENKMMVYDISEETDPRYEGGFLRNFFVSANHSIGSYMNWTAQRGAGVSSGAKVSSSASLGTLFTEKIWKFLRLAVNGEVSLGVSQSISSNTSHSARRAVDERAGEGLFLTVGQAAISVGVTKFQNCLVVKPRPNAFTAKFEQGLPVLYENVWSQEAQDNSFKKVLVSRPGLIICNPIEEKNEKNEENQAKEITEYYYYFAHQVQAENSQFLNLYDLANRPFVMILRGSKEFAKLYYMLRRGLDGKEALKETEKKEREYAGKLSIVPPSLFQNYTWPIEDSIGLALDIREFNETGFHPGVYHYPYNEDPLEAIFTQHENNPTLDLLDENYILFHRVPLTPDGTVSIEAER